MLTADKEAANAGLYNLAADLDKTHGLQRPRSSLYHSSSSALNHFMNAPNKIPQTAGPPCPSAGLWEGTSRRFTTQARWAAERRRSTRERALGPGRDFTGFIGGPDSSYFLLGLPDTAPPRHREGDARGTALTLPILLSVRTGCLAGAHTTRGPRAYAPAAGALPPGPPEGPGERS